MRQITSMGSGDPISGLEDAASGGLTMVVPVHFKGSSAPNHLNGGGDPNSGAGSGHADQDQHQQQEEVTDMPECKEWMPPRGRRVKNSMAHEWRCCHEKVQKEQQ